MALADLLPLLLWAIAFALAYMLSRIALAVGAAFGGLPWPLDKIASPIASAANAVGAVLTNFADNAEGQMAKWFAGLSDWVLLILVAPLLIVLGIEAALKALWHDAIPRYVASQVAPVRDAHAATRAQVAALTATVAADAARTRDYAKTQADAALGDAKTYARTQSQAARNSAEAYADEAVAKLRTSEHTALENVKSIADAARNDAAAAVSTALGITGRVAVPGTRGATGATGATGAAGAAGTAAPPASLPSIDDLLGIAGAAGLIASIPALATAVTSIATETGLDNASCRGKVKQICGTNTGAWTSLLEGFVALGVGFNLRELAKAAETIAGDVADVIRQAA